MSDAVAAVRALPWTLLAITDGRRGTPPDAVRAAVDVGGPRVAILLREPGIAAPELLAWVEWALPICRAAGTTLLVHADAEVARRAGADGVHLPERGVDPATARQVVGADRWIGASRHDAAGLAAVAVADYATLSPVYAVPGKGPALGLTRFAELARGAATPVVALGGVTPARVAECRGHGAAAVAAIRAVWQGPVTDNVRRFLERDADPIRAA